MKIPIKYLFFALIAFLFVFLKYLGFFQPLELGIYDQFWQLAPLEAPDPRIIIVGIEEEDIRDLGQWPMSDEQLAEIIDLVDAQNPTVIGLDIFRDLAPKGRLKAIFETNERLIGVGVHHRINFPPALRAREKVGDVAIEDEPQWGYMRRIPLYRVFDGSKDSRISHVSLELAIHWLFQQSESFTLKAQPKTHDLMINNKVINPLPRGAGGYSEGTEGNYQMLIRWRKGPYSASKWEENFKIVTLKQIKEGQIAPNLFTDKMVLIGVRADSIKDQHITPLGWRYGVDTIAHGASQIISYIKEDRPFFKFIPEGLEYGLILLLVSLVYLHYRYLSFERIWWELGIQCGVAFVVMTSIYWLGYGAFIKAWWIPVGQLLVTYGVAFALMLLGSYIGYLYFVTQNQEKIISQKTAELENNLEELRKTQENNLLMAKQVTLAQLSDSLTHNLENYIGVLKGCWERLIIVIPRQDPVLVQSELDLMRDTFLEFKDIFQNLRGIKRNPDFLKSEEFNLQDLILERVKSASDKVELSLDISAINICMPRALLEEVLRNLITNAWDSMRDSSRKHLHLETSLMSESQFKITIADTGSGIAPEKISKIYEPLYTTKSEGWGLGLYFVYQAVLYLKGQIEVHSEEGEGTTFSLTLPINFSE